MPYPKLGIVILTLSLRRFKVIQVTKKSDQEYLIAITERGSRTEHVVTLDDEYYQNLTDGKITKEELIKKSFEFLLERESKESILSKFNLKIIKNYFPEYEDRIKYF